MCSCLIAAINKEESCAIAVLTSWTIKKLAPITFQLFVSRNALLLLFTGTSLALSIHLPFLGAAGFWVCHLGVSTTPK